MWTFALKLVTIASKQKFSISGISEFHICRLTSAHSAYELLKAEIPCVLSLVPSLFLRCLVLYCFTIKALHIKCLSFFSLTSVPVPYHLALQNICSCCGRCDCMIKQNLKGSQIQLGL